MNITEIDKCINELEMIQNKKLVNPINLIRDNLDTLSIEELKVTIKGLIVAFNLKADRINELQNHVIELLRIMKRIELSNGSDETR